MANQKEIIIYISVFFEYDFLQIFTQLLLTKGFLAMTYYLYIPIPRKKFPLDQQEAVNKWVELEKQKNKNVILCYQGEKIPPLPAKAKVGVWLHGTPGRLPSSTFKAVDSEIARHYPSISSHLHLTHKKESVLVPQIADDLVKDGLLQQFSADSQHSMRIKLFFFDAGKQAETLASAFRNALSKYEHYHQGDIRIDYYPGQLSELKTKQNGEPAHKFIRSTQSGEEQRAKTIRQTLYNREDAAPKLTMAQVNKVVQQYRDYKSSRLGGLSGRWGLNSFFSSDASLAAIQTLENNRLSDTQRFHQAVQFLKRYPTTHLAKYLHPEVEASQKDNNQRYSTQPALG
ncbi:hypothetical protein D6J04_07435 [Legionella taurinensis]|uniref:Uncharacterized protein n=2 Tax=Legionella taurinensis TaxID=70611 RepID=A0A3A5L4I7_9GAMM|nr:hypothetical protein D6J04_07435 [Legionella taurinensis]RJT68659.1 hypothetical protein D6J03_04345 [Legionella taurinensis]